MAGALEYLQRATDRARSEFAGFLDRHDLVAVSDADEQRSTERGDHSREVQPISHRLLRDRELLGVDLSKQQQSSDWGAPDITSEQLAYAASDVLHLHALWTRLEGLLRREGRLPLAEACFRFLPTRGELDLLGYADPDILAH